MVVEYGRVTPDGRLPVFSVDTEEDAKSLIIGACPRDTEGRYFARELAAEQTLPRLYAFSDRLAEVYEVMMKRRKEAVHGEGAQLERRRP